MSEGITALSLDEIAALDLNTPTKRTTKKTIDTSVRNFDTWFKLHTSFGVCSNPNCKDDRDKKVEEGNAMVAIVKDRAMCRICFIGGWLA